MRASKTASLLGLATKAGRLVSGEFLTEKAVKKRKSSPGDVGVRCIGQYKEDVHRYVYLL